MKKLFKIGEYAIGGIIDVRIKKDSIDIMARAWNTKQIVSQKTFDTKPVIFLYSIDEYLNDLTTSYYAEKILTWLKSNL